MNTYCAHGHRQTPTTVYRRPNGKGSYCRICKRLAENARYAQDEEYHQRELERAKAKRRSKKAQQLHDS